MYKRNYIMVVLMIILPIISIGGLLDSIFGISAWKELSDNTDIVINEHVRKYIIMTSILSSIFYVVSTLCLAGCFFCYINLYSSNKEAIEIPTGTFAWIIVPYCMISTIYGAIIYDDINNSIGKYYMLTFGMFVGNIVLFVVYIILQIPICMCEDEYVTKQEKMFTIRRQSQLLV
jgi:hypothetical protein